MHLRYNLPMPRTAAELLEEARQLSQADRDWLAQELLHPPGDGSTEAEHEAAWSDEIERRIQELRDGTAKTYSLEEAKTRLGLPLRQR